MRIQHNIMALNAYRQLGGNNSALAKNLEKLSSGYRINRAGDDAAGLAISEKMRAQIKGLEAAQKNANDGISLVQTAEGALTEVHSMLNRMVYLATQSANGTYDNEVDRANLDKEVQTLKEEINRISQSTNFNGLKLLDGSMDNGASRTVYSDAFNIAEYVGDTKNATAIVGTGTIVHDSAKEAQKAEFAVEFNNSTVSGKDGVSITLGEGDKAVKIELTAKEIGQGASAEEIAAAFEKKLAGGQEFISETGDKVMFDAKADGSKLVFTQAAAPTKASEIVNGSLAVTYTGIGGTAEETTTLNTTKPSMTSGTSTNAGTDTGTLTSTNSFEWETKDDAAKQALNDALGSKAINITFRATEDTANDGDISAMSADISKLQEQLKNAGYTITATLDGADVAIGSDGRITIDPAKNNKVLALTIADKDGNDIATMSMTPNAAFATDTNADGDLTLDVAIKAGDITVMNGEPVVDGTDGSKLFDNAGKFDPSKVTLETSKTDLMNALNDAIGSEGGSITFKLDKLAGNSADANTELTFELSKALADAGYFISKVTPAGASPTATELLGGKVTDAIKGIQTGDTTLYLSDASGNLVGTFTLNTDGINLTGEATTISLKQNGFNKGETTAITGDAAKVTIESDDADLTKALKATTWAAAGNNFTDDLAGKSLKVKVDGVDYEITLRKGGMTDPDAANGAVSADGKEIDLTHANATTDDTVMTAIQKALELQMAANAKEAAAGTKDYTAYTNDGTAISITVQGDGTLSIGHLQKTSYTYVSESAPATPGNGDAAAAGGKDPNASTVTITNGQVAGDVRLASTYVTADAFKGLKDGSQLKIGDTTYTFAVGKDSKVTGDNVVDLKDLKAEDKELVFNAMERLTVAAKDNAMFSVGHDEPGRLTFTEKKTYAGGEDLSTRENIAKQFGFAADGVTTGKTLMLQVGDTADSYQKVGLDIKDMSTEGLDIADINIKTQESASDAIAKIKDAINTVSSQRGDLGAIQNRLEHTINNLGVQTENITAAESRIRDTDMAEEMMAYTKNNILIQAAQAMLAQANQVPQGILQLLQ